MSGYSRLDSEPEGIVSQMHQGINRLYLGGRTVGDFPVSYGPSFYSFFFVSLCALAWATKQNTIH